MLLYADIWLSGHQTLGVFFGYHFKDLELWELCLSNRGLPEKLTGSQLLKKFPTLYGTQTFITGFTSTPHLSLFWARSTQSTPLYSSSGKSILLLLSHLCLGFPNCLFTSSLPTKALYITLLFPIRPANHYSWFSHPNIFLCTLLWNTLSRCSSLNIKEPC